MLSLTEGETNPKGPSSRPWANLVASSDGAVAMQPCVSQVADPPIST